MYDFKTKINAATRVADYNNEICIENNVITNGSLWKADVLYWKKSVILVWLHNI